MAEGITGEEQLQRAIAAEQWYWSEGESEEEEEETPSQAPSQKEPEVGGVRGDSVFVLSLLDNRDII